MSNYIVFDAGGLLLHSYHGCTEKTIEGRDGLMPSWEDGLAAFISRYLDVLKDVSPRQILACFDGGNNARRRLYVGYKEHRRDKLKEEDPLKSEQLRKLKEEGRRFLAYLGCRTLHVPGEEADDLVGLIVNTIEADHFTIYTRDKDLLQLVSDRVTVVCGGEVYDLSGFARSDLEGVPFGLIVLMKAICGDSSDGYPGIKGCGPKFFENLMAAHGEAGLLRIDQAIRENQRDDLPDCPLAHKLKENWETLRLMHRIATIEPAHCYGALNGKRKAPEWTVRVPNQKVIEDYLHKLGVQKPDWARFFPVEHLINDDRNGEIEHIAKEILTSPIVSYDYETTDKVQHGPFKALKGDYVDVLSQSLVSLSVNFGQNLEKTVYFPFDHAQTENLPLEWAVWLLQVLQMIERPVVQNAAFELSVTATALGIPLKAPYDTAIMAMYVDENEENHLKGMSKGLLNYTQATYKEVTQGRRMDELTAEEALSYGCDDSLVTGHLFDVYRHMMQMEGSWAFYAQHEVDWAIDNAYYFIEGTEIDLHLLEEFRVEAERRRRTGMETMHRALAENCNARQTTETATACAKLLLDEWWVMAGRKFTAEEQDAANVKYQELWQKAWAGCFYTPPTQRVELKFAPTAAQLSAVAHLISKQIPKLSKVSIKGIEAWEIDAVDALELARKAGPVDPLADTFITAVYQARKDLKGRTGPAYQALESLCLDTLQERGNLKAIMEGDQLCTNSADQMQMLLYGKLQLPLRRRSKVAYGSTRKKLNLPGGPATGIKAIQAAFVHDIQDEDWRAEVLTAYLDVAKVTQEISLYYDSYPLFAHPRDGKIHPQIKNCGTATRRPSGTAPNALQVAKGPMRTLYRAGEDRVYVCADFASQEIQILACESRDPVMLRAFTSEPRLDLHSMTAAGFAHVVMPRHGVQVNGQPSYEEFIEWLGSEDKPELAKAAKTTRNKYAKACVAEGSLVLTDRGLVPIEHVTLTDKVWDGVDWVAHEGVICKGERVVVTYEGVTATPDHEVYLNDGRKIPIGEARSQPERPCLAVGEIEGTPVRYTGDGFGRILGRSKVEGYNQVSSVRENNNVPDGESFERENCALSMSTSKVCREKDAITGRSVRSSGPAVQQSELARIQELRWERNKESVSLSTGVCEMGDREPTARDVQGCSVGQNKQQRTLRTWEFKTCYKCGKQFEQTKQCYCELSEYGNADSSCVACAESAVPGVPLRTSNGQEVYRERKGSDSCAPTQTGGQLRKKVFDIVNAGPRHRFTVSGHIVANCNFGIAYGAGPTTLAENLLVNIDFAKELMNGVFNLYKRIQPWQGEVEEFAKTFGYSVTAYGNRRHAPKELWSSDRGESSRAARQVINAVIQSTAADILKIVLNDMFRREMRQRYQLLALKPVYDEISASVPISLAVDYAQELIEVMSITPPGYPVGMKVDLSIGKTWGSQVEIKHPTADNIQAAIESLLK